MHTIIVNYQIYSPTSTFIYQDSDDDVEARQQTLNAVLRNGQTMLKQDVSPEDKDNIKKDLENLQARFSKVGCLTLISWRKCLQLP